jgi:single-stranded-DNA-specific exonuclease
LKQPLKPGKHYGFGDYDVDGTTAVSLVSSYLKSYYPNVRIANRYDDMEFHLKGLTLQMTMAFLIIALDGI